MSELLKFHIFRYHLNPLSNKEQHINGKIKTVRDLKELKNTIFNEILQSLNFYKDSRHPLKIEYNEKDIYIIKIAQKKTIEQTSNFKVRLIPNEPFVYVLVNNSPSVQKIAISENREAFRDPTTTKNILEKILNRELSNKESFWQLVENNENRIKSIKFKYIKPNLANISSSLSEAFKNFTNRTNSNESHIFIKSPKNGHLENINKFNEEINGLIDYTSEGAGEVSMKIEGIRQEYSTKNNPVIITIKEIEINGNSEQVTEVFKKLLY